MIQTLKKGEISFSSIFSFFIFIILLIVLIYLLYVLYQNIPGEPEKLEIQLQEQKPEQKTITEAKQFYTNMKFNHNLITYNIDINCDENKISRMTKAFDELHTKVEEISFKEIREKADITISCTQSKEETITEDYFIAGEGGAKEIIDTGKYHVIVEGIIYLYDNDRKSLNCDYPNIEVHELLHVLGFDHVDDKNSIMYLLLESCYQQLDNSIINELNKLYEMENLPELYFDDLEVLKKGRYLDFNATIKNSGVVDVENMSLSIFDDDTILDTYYIDAITLGGGITITTQNFKLKDRNPEIIRFVIDEENKIKEIDEKNNIIEIKL